MDELKVQQSNGSITTNLDAIEAEIRNQMAEYENYLVTEDSIKSDKKVLADLRKLRKNLDDSRKEVKKTWLLPYEKFESRCKEVLALVDEPINLINTQLKLFDEERVAKKREHVQELYSQTIQGLERFLPLEKIYKDEWNNASCNDQTITYDINEMVLKVKNDLTAIHALGSEIEEEVIGTYERFGNDLSMAIQRNSQYLADKAKLEEKAKEVSESVKEPENEPVNEPAKPLPVEQLNDLVNKVKTVKIVISYEDLQKVQNILDFSEIKYQILED